MKTYFCASDIHSFYNEYIENLYAQGFDENNPEHIILINGDLFDRGDGTLQLYDFVKTIPKERRILIKGNHEDLFRQLVEKEYPDSYDFHNGTVKTFCQIANVKYKNNYSYSEWNDICKIVSSSDIYKFISSDEWRNYYEIDNFIFTHAFIPLHVKKEYEFFQSYSVYELSTEMLEMISDWRVHASDEDWKDARWLCPWEMFQAGLFDIERYNNGKTLVVGHWHTSDFYAAFENDNTKGRTCPIFKMDNLIAIDACTAYTGRVNILVINEK